MRGRRYLARLEAVGDRARVFLDGRLILDTKRPKDAAGKDLPLYAAIGQQISPVFVHSLRVCQLDEKAEQSLPKIKPPNRSAAEWQTWSHSLTTPDALDSFYCASGQYGPYNTWLLAEIVENEGIKIRGGHTQTILWAPVSVDNSYQVSIEAKQAQKGATLVSASCWVPGLWKQHRNVLLHHDPRQRCGPHA